MLRAIRISFLSILGLALVTVAIANRGGVTIRLLPEEIETFFGMATQTELPLYLIIYGGIVAGLLIGFFWEWIREARIRAEAGRAKQEVTQLQREVRSLRAPEKGGKDDVIALLE